MSFFKRLFNIGAAEANNALDKLEDPIKLTEQGVRDLKSDLNKSLQGLAELKALAIRAKKEHQQHIAQSKNYEQKAVLLLQKAQAGQMDAGEADRLASEMLRKKEEADQHANRTAQELQMHEGAANKMNSNIQTLKSKIGSYENELRTLKARHKVSSATQKINKQLAQVDSSSTVAMLERMKDKVNEQEALAESYGEIAFENKSVDDEVDAALGSGTSSAALLELKSRMGIEQKSSASDDAGTDDTNKTA